MLKCFAQTGCILSILTVFCSAITSKKYMTDYCMRQKDILLNNSMVLDLTDTFFDKYQAEFEHCATDVVTSPGNRILLHFITLDISYDEHTPDRLHIFDYGTNNLPVRLTPGTGVFGMYETYEHMTSDGVKDYRSTLNKLRLDFLGKPTIKYNGFSVLLTSFKDADNFKCKPNYLRCSVENICVPNSLRCDGQSNCGSDDSSDEKSCVSQAQEDWRNNYAATTALVVGIVASGIFLCTALVIGLLVYKLNKRRFSSSGTILPGRRPTRNTSMTNDGDMTRMYAPPSYEDVVGAIEAADPPPDYNSVASESPTHSYTMANGISHDKQKLQYNSNNDINEPSPAYENIEIGRPSSDNAQRGCVIAPSDNKNHSVSVAQRNKGNSIRCQPMIHRIQRNSEEEEEINNGTDCVSQGTDDMHRDDGCNSGKEPKSINNEVMNQN